MKREYKIWEYRQVVPLGDLYDHQTHRLCDCKPSVIMSNDNVPILVHHSYDLREAVEQAETILGYGLMYGDRWELIWEADADLKEG